MLSLFHCEPSPICTKQAATVRQIKLCPPNHHFPQAVFTKKTGHGVKCRTQIMIFHGSTSFSKYALPLLQNNFSYVKPHNIYGNFFAYTVIFASKKRGHIVHPRLIDMMHHNSSPFIVLSFVVCPLCYYLNCFISQKLPEELLLLLPDHQY